jgi:cytochrome d ubiquinol oxidase subunit I
MGMSLAFHIVFACIGIALPLMMVAAEIAWLRTKDGKYLELAKRWAKGSAILFAVGAVSGTILSFELGLLWPKFMHFAGPVIGLGFALEGFAFFGEAIFLGIYLYGWQRINARAHVISGMLVAFYGALSGVFVVTANAWMNTPTGFVLLNGQPTEISPIKALLNPAAAGEAVHMLLASYLATAAAMAGIHAFLLLKNKRNVFHQKALLITVVLSSVMALIQPLAGDYVARVVALTQPTKLAALEGQFKTEKYAPLRIGGLVDVKAHQTRYAIEIPGALSLLAFHDPSHEIKGLDSVPTEDWPAVPLVHINFQIMVACGGALSLVALWACFLLFRKRQLHEQRGFLLATVLVSPLGMVAVETGWLVTELGRQPWVIYGVLRTIKAATPVPGVAVQMLIYFSVYVLLAAVVVWILSRQIAQTKSPVVLANSKTHAIR